MCAWGHHVCQKERLFNESNYCSTYRLIRYSKWARLACKQNYLSLWLCNPFDTPYAACRSTSPSKSLLCMHTRGYWYSCTSVSRPDLKNTGCMVDNRRCSSGAQCRNPRCTAGTRCAESRCSASAGGNPGRTLRTSVCVRTVTRARTCSHSERAPMMWRGRAP